MKKWFKKFLAGTAACSMIACSCAIGAGVTDSKADEIKIDETEITDSQLLSLMRQADTNGDGVLSDEEAGAFTYLYFYEETSDISEAVKIFPNANSVYINAGNNTSVTVNSTKIKSIQVSGSNVVALKGAAPTRVYAFVNAHKASLNFSGVEGYAKTTEFFVYGAGKSTKVTVPNTAKLKKVGISNCGLTSIDVSKFKNASEITLDNNKLKTINLKKNPKLTSLACYANKLTKLNISSNKKLKDIGVGSNQLKTIDITKNKNISRVIAYDNKISSLKSNKSAKITELSLSENKLTSLDLTKYPKLTSLYVGSNKFKKLNIAKNTKIQELFCSENPIKVLATAKLKSLKSLDVAGTSVKKLSYAKKAALNYISVGTSHSLLKNVKLAKGYATVGIKVKANKTYQLAKLLPAVKGYKFSTNSSIISVSGSGALKTGSVSKSMYEFVSAVKGSNRVSFTITK